MLPESAEKDEVSTFNWEEEEVTNSRMGEIFANVVEWEAKRQIFQLTASATRWCLLASHLFQ